MSAVCSVSFLFLCVVQYGRSCLHMAIEEGHVGIVKELLTSAACELTRVEVSVPKYYN